jgi:hypothetical protein
MTETWVLSANRFATRSAASWIGRERILYLVSHASRNFLPRRRTLCGNQLG